MTLEVISLLSSPPPAAAAQPRKSTPPAQRRIIPPSDVSISDDPFNEDIEDDNIITQSTSRPSFAAFRNLPKRQAGTKSASDDIWGSLDDDDFFKSPSPKRQRLSTDSRNLTTTTCTASSIHQATAASRPRSSSLEFTSPVRLNTSTKPTEPSAPRYTVDYDDDDPFASPPPHRKEDSVRRAPGLDSQIEEVELHYDSDDNLFVSNDTPKRKDNNRKQKAPDVAVPWDPISSSAPLPTTSRNTQPEQQPRAMQRSVSEVITLDDSDDEPINNNPITMIESSEDEFPDIDKLDGLDPLLTVPRWKDSGRSRSTGSTKPKAPRKPGSKATSVRRTSEEVAKGKEDRAAKAAAREAEREHKKQQAEQAKKEKALEKQRAAALAEVNKVRTDKKVSTPEMIVDLPDTLTGSLRLQVETLLKDLDVQTEERSCPLDNVVTWRRKVRATYNEELGHWEPIPMRIEKEKYAMAILTSSEFVQRVLATDGADLEAHVISMQREFPDHTIIYLIESLEPWMRKNRNLRNRQFVSAVLGDQAPPSTQERRRRKNTEPTEYVDEDKIEDALLQLQVLHGVLIHHTNTAVETAQWIAIFTQHISTVPYRRQREESNAAGAGFCMEAGQVRTGDGAKDTYVRLLQEIGRVTAPIAYGIAAEFESVSQLVKGLEEGGPLSLESVRKSANKDGALTDRTVGQAMSRRIYKIFTGKDATSTEV